MAIYLLEQHIVLDIVDDPCRDGVDTEAFGELPVLTLTCAELAQLEPGSLNAKSQVSAKAPCAVGSGGDAA